MLKTNKALAILALGICTTFACGHNDAAHAETCKQIMDQNDQNLKKMINEDLANRKVTKEEYSKRTKAIYTATENKCKQEAGCEWISTGAGDNAGTCSDKRK